MRPNEGNPAPGATDLKQGREKRAYICDRCGHAMIEKQCKISCPNCGSRFDCSDLNIHFD